MEKQELLERINLFINHDKDMSYATDGWDEVKPDELLELSILCSELIKARFRKDVDGDLPVNIQLVNRNVGEFILHSNMVKYKASKREVYNLASAVSSISNRASSMALRLLEDE